MPLHCPDCFLALVFNSQRGEYNNLNCQINLYILDSLCFIIPKFPLPRRIVKCFQFTYFTQMKFLRKINYFNSL